MLTLAEDRYVSDLLAGLDAYPAYYAHMGPANAAGPSGADLSAPRRADAGELRRRIDAGEWVVDLRARRTFAAGHVAGTLSFDLDGSFATYLGWLIPWGTPLTLLGQTPEQVAEAQRELVRIGIDRPAAAATGHPDDWAGGRALRSYPVADFAGLESVRRHRPVVVLDVRRDQEWDASHISGAVHVPLHQLPARLAEVPAGEVWVHCEAGYRASRRRVVPGRRGPDGRRRGRRVHPRRPRGPADRRSPGARGGDVTTYQPEGHTEREGRARSSQFTGLPARPVVTGGGLNEKGRGELPCLIDGEPGPGTVLGIHRGADAKADAPGRVGAAAEGEMAYLDLPAARGPDADVMAGAVGTGSPAGHGMPPSLLALGAASSLCCITPAPYNAGGGGYSALMNSSAACAFLMGHGCGATMNGA